MNLQFKTQTNKIILDLNSSCIQDIGLFQNEMSIVLALYEYAHRYIEKEKICHKQIIREKYLARYQWPKHYAIGSRIANCRKGSVIV